MNKQTKTLLLYGAAAFALYSVLGRRGAYAGPGGAFDANGLPLVGGEPYLGPYFVTYNPDGTFNYTPQAAGS